MLSSLSIRDIILIETLDIEFSSGLSVLTGETGAGKSIVLDALSLVLGSRGDASLVRKGASHGHVIAVFDIGPNHCARTILQEHNLSCGHELILRRVQMLDGKTRAFINDQPVSLTTMRTIGHTLVEIHGQHDDRAFVDPSTHRNILDLFGGHNGAVEDCRFAWRKWREAEEELSAQKVILEEARREADYLSSTSKELEALAPEEGEEERLSVLRIDTMNMQKASCEIQDLYASLVGEKSPSQTILSCLRRLERKTDPFPALLDPIIKDLEQALIMLDSASCGAEMALKESAINPLELERIEERLFALRAAARKYNVAPDMLPMLSKTIHNNLENLTFQEKNVGELEKNVAELKELYDKQASYLSSLRSNAAKELRSCVLAELPALKLGQADFLVELASSSSHRTENGIDRIEFQIRTNPNGSYGSMMKIASGGELSRFLLALKVSLAQKGSLSVLIFDEIDTGVSGSVSDAIGQKLLHLSQSVQIFAVTHAPQVAACCDVHFLVSRNNDSPRIKRMNEEERVEEIARMLAGERITQEARAAALRLLHEKKCL